MTVINVGLKGRQMLPGLLEQHTKILGREGARLLFIYNLAQQDTKKHAGWSQECMSY